MKKETYIKIKKQKRRSRLLAIITTLSLMGSAISEKDENKIAQDEYLGPVLIDGQHIEIVDTNGIAFPTKLKNFSEKNLMYLQKCVFHYMIHMKEIKKL